MRRLYRTYVPAAVQEKLAVYAKAVVGASVTAAGVVALVLPDYSDEAQVVVGIVAVVATFLGVKATRNARA